MIDIQEHKIMEFIAQNSGISSMEIHEGMEFSGSYATLKRALARLIDREYLVSTGKGKGTKYLISPAFELIKEIDVEEYYEKEIDEREIKNTFNFDLITEVLDKVNLFTDIELATLNRLQREYEAKVKELSEAEFLKEMERLAVDLSWKSSQIEGNTYSLLETEQLLKEKQTAAGKTKEEAIMLLNHKEAIDFILENKDYLNPISVPKIEDIHNMLTKELGVQRNLRKRRVGITGTNYVPLDNEFQIKDAVQNTCTLINKKENGFEKALLALVLISYIQPYMDGNKRTARISSNALLIGNGHCPLSFRTVDPIEYKKAMLIFYERNNIWAFKKIFMEQLTFAVSTYF